MRAPGYQVLFALLALPELAKDSIRTIARAAGTSRQPVIHLLSRLCDEGFLVYRDDKLAWVDRPLSPLLERWLAGYASSVRPKLYVGRYRLPAQTPPEVERWLEAKLGQVRFSGTAGAFRLDRHYRGPHTIIHLEPSEQSRRALEAAPSPDGELVWLAPMSAAGNEGKTTDTVHPLLIYSELMVDPDPRAREAAELLRKNWLPWSR